MKNKKQKEQEKEKEEDEIKKSQRKLEKYIELK